MTEYHNKPTRCTNCMYGQGRPCPCREQMSAGDVWTALALVVLPWLVVLGIVVMAVGALG